MLPPFAVSLSPGTSSIQSATPLFERKTARFSFGEISIFVPWPALCSQNPFGLILTSPKVCLVKHVDTIRIYINRRESILTICDLQHDCSTLGSRVTGESKSLFPSHKLVQVQKHVGGNGPCGEFDGIDVRWDFRFADGQ